MCYIKYRGEIKMAVERDRKEEEHLIRQAIQNGMIIDEAAAATMKRAQTRIDEKKDKPKDVNREDEEIDR